MFRSEKHDENRTALKLASGATLRCSWHRLIEASDDPSHDAIGRFSCRFRHQRSACCFFASRGPSAHEEMLPTGRERKGRAGMAAVRKCRDRARLRATNLSTVENQTLHCLHRSLPFLLVIPRVPCCCCHLGPCALLAVLDASSRVN